MDADFSQFDSILAKVASSTETVVEWDEEGFVPCSPAEMRDGLRAAMVEARAKGWIPQEDPGCECLPCRSFRAYVA